MFPWRNVGALAVQCVCVCVRGGVSCGICKGGELSPLRSSPGRNSPRTNYPPPPPVGLKLCVKLGYSPRSPQMVPKWPLAGQLAGTDFGNTRS